MFEQVCRCLNLSIKIFKCIIFILCDWNLSIFPIPASWHVHNPFLLILCYFILSCFLFLALVSGYRPELSLLISGPASGSCRRRRRQTVRCALPIRLHVWAISSHRLASGCSQKKEGRGPWLLFTLGSGSRPQWLRKRRPRWFFKQHSLWKQQTGHEPRSGVWTGTVKDGSFWSNLHKGAGSQAGTVESARFKEVFFWRGRLV